MDHRRFDDLARVLSGAAGSRRETLAIALGSASAAVFGLLGIEETEAQRRRNDRNRNRNRKKKNNKKKKRICHCPDSTGNNCESLKLTKKEAKRHLNKHPDDYNGDCDDCQTIDTECNVNRPGECCAANCCFDTTSSAGGVCPTIDANCCGLTTTGGYCTTSFPQCCGEEACCRGGEVCCANVRVPTGYCCPAGSICDFNQFNGCAFPQEAESVAFEGAVTGHAEPRGRAGR